MRLLTRAAEDGPRLAVMTSDGGVADVVDLLMDGPWSIDRLLQSPDRSVASISAALAAADPPVAREASSVASLPPVQRPGKIIAVGRNYRDHAAEEGVAPPADPVIFTKFTSSLVGPGADIRWRSRDTTQVDFEAELAVVIGRTARDVPLERALDHVLGYTCLNDISARDLQFADGQWVRAKSLDTFCPMGPWIVTADEIRDPTALRIRCEVNGETLQDADTGQMIHGVAELIAFCSRFMTLDPGDVIATGTPGGVGVFRDPPRFLADGDEVIVEIESIGRLVNHCCIDG